MVGFSALREGVTYPLSYDTNLNTYFHCTFLNGFSLPFSLSLSIGYITKTDSNGLIPARVHFPVVKALLIASKHQNFTS